MGKKKGAAKRAKKRADAAAADLLEQTIENQEIARYEQKDDGDLFVLDTIPDAAKAVAVSKKRKKSIKNSSEISDVKQSKRNRISEKDERQIRKMMSKHSKEIVVSLAAARAEREQERKRLKRSAGLAKTGFNLWDDSAPENKDTKVMPFKSGVKSMAGTAPVQFQAVTKKSLRKDIQQPAILSKKHLKSREADKARAPNTVKVEPAQAGQSYRPDEEQHQDVIGEALSIELRRKEALDYKNAPIGGGGMREETLALIINSSDEESSDEEDSDNDDEPDAKAPAKRKEKLTRAQRNKQKRFKAEQLALEERRRKKKLMHTLNESKTVAKQVRKEEAMKISRRKEINTLKEEKRAQPIGVNIFEKLSEKDPINAPSLPVALTEELKDSSLRRIRPKGSLLTDRMESLISRKLANGKVTRTKQSVHGKRRKNMKGGKGREFILA